jgi:hypothetical protein
MNQAMIDGATLEHEVRGSGEPVVLVHGSCIAEAFAPLPEQPARVQGLADFFARHPIHTGDRT